MEADLYFLFLDVPENLISDVVTNFDFSVFRALRLIRMMRRHDMSNKKTKT